ncbi:MAG: 4Fe-4S dicluster domain-containing protein [Acidobacteria bacterium]|nr:MAG: 4Fe-4S dicluster domain-containing protein [Acidobacteriota bacterium]
MVAKDLDGREAAERTPEPRQERPTRAAGVTLTVLDDDRVASAATTVDGDQHREPEGQRMWRSLEEYADAEALRERIESEFPRYAPSEWDDGPSRRAFLKLAGASMGLAGMAACTRQPNERIVPYVDQPEYLVPGKAQHYATAMPMDGYLTPLLAESHMGRPTKVAGNPEHPLTQGTNDLFAQASVLDLYDPDRSANVSRGGRITPWETLVAEIQPTLRALEALSGEGLRIVTAPTSSPTMVALIDAVRQRFPQARWTHYEPVARDAALAASRAAFGVDVETHYDLSQADVVVSLEADFLNSGPHRLRMARDFAQQRRLLGDKRTMSRYYAVESVPTGSSSLADHRLIVRPAELAAFAGALAARVGATGAVAADLASAPGAEEWLAAVSEDLMAHRGRCAVIAGDAAPAPVHVLAHAINAALGNVGATVRYTDPVIAEPELGGAVIADLAREISEGQVEALFLLGVNPVYDAPGDVDFAAALADVPLSLHLGPKVDETAAACTWHVPQSHYLEAWGDGRAADGTLSIVQPLIEPMYASKSELEVLAMLAGQAELDSYELVRQTWRNAGLEAQWQKVLHDGFVIDSALPEKTVALAPDAAGVAARSAAEALAAQAAAAEGEVDLLLRLDPSLHDGRFANNGWLQEIPKPLTKVAWDQTVQISRATAERLGVSFGDVVRVSAEGRSLVGPAWVQPGQAPETVVVHYGYGHTAIGRTGDGNGENAHRLRGSAGTPARATIEKTGRSQKIASTQEHYQLELQSEQAERRHLVKHGTLAHFKEDEHFVEHLGHHIPTAPMFDRWEYPGNSWGMAIDLGLCTGCNACIVACQAENNIPVVGREQVIAGREMHWLRIDRYFQGDLDAPKVHHQPVACQQCEQAPCEVVCPVGATVHNHEGLNDMVYNRCIGTRYCSNNCPYKVRRFNFFKYQDTKTPVLKLQRNPDVSVRARGVMEKCTYCVQRINRVRQKSKVERRPIRDGEIKTACQEVCPTQAIVFGDINDETTQVSQWKKSPLNYQLLEELATLPRTTYLAKIDNPNPALDDGHGGGHGGGHSAGGDHGEGHSATAGDDHSQPTAQH